MDNGISPSQILCKLRSTERKMIWVSGFLSSHNPNPEVTSMLEQTIVELKKLEERLLELERRNNERTLHNNKTDSTDESSS